MPAAVAAVAAAVGTTVVTVGGVAITVGTILQAAVLVSSALYNRSRARAAQRGALAAYNASLIDHQVIIRSAVAPRTVTYGRDKVSGPLVFGHSSGTKKEFLHLVIALGGHEFADIEKIFFNEIELPALDGGGYVTSGQFCRTFTRSVTDSTSAGSLVLAHTPSRIVGVTKATGSGDAAAVIPLASPADYTLSGSTVTFVGGPLVGGDAYTVNYEWEQVEPRVRIKKYMGNAGQVADAALISESGGKWTADHVGVGIPYLYVRLEYDRQVFGQIGVPNISGYAKGKKVLDTRTSVVAWSDNDALCTADYMRDSTLGMGCTAAQVPASEVNTGANISDEAVPVVSFARAALLSHWNTAADLESWTVSNATTAVAGGVLRLTSTSSDPQLRRAGLSISGTVNRTIRARLKRIAGSGWEGNAFYTTSGHGESASFHKQVSAPTYDANGWAIVEWDMAALTVGGTDWISNTITGIRLDLGTTSSDIFDIDWVAVGSEDTQKRYTFNGTLSTGTGRLDNLRTLMLPMAGSAVWVQGRWLLRAGAHRSSEFTLDESWIAGPRKIMPRSPRTELFNAVTGNFVDADQNFAEVQYPIVSNAGYETADGGKRIVQTIPMPGVNNSIRAQRLAKIAIERARQALTMTLVCNMRAYDTVPTQVGTVNLARYGYVGTQVEVLRREFNPQGRTVTLTLRQTAAAVWDWAYGEATMGDPAPDTSLPSWSDPPPALTSLAVASGTSHLLKLADGSIITRGYVTWAAVTSAFVQRGGRIELAWKLDSDASWQTAPPLAGDDMSAYIAPLDDRRLTIVRVRAVSDLGREGPWSYVFHTVVGKTAAPENVAGFAATKIPGAVSLTWTRSTEVDHKYTELRIGGASWAAGSTLFAGDTDRFDWAWPAAGTYTFRAKHRDTSDNESVTAAQVTVTLTAEEIGVFNVQFRPNLLPNGGFEFGTLLWNFGGTAANFVVTDSVWGRSLVSTSVANGVGVLESAFFPVFAGATYTVAGDSLLLASTVVTSYFDMLFYDASSVLLDGGQNQITTAHDFSATDANRAVHAVAATAPAGAVKATARYVWDASGVTAVGARNIKVERGPLPHTAYSQYGVIVAGGVSTANLALASATTTVTAKASAASASLSGGAPGDVTVTACSAAYVNDTGATISVQVETSHYDAYVDAIAFATDHELFLDQTGAIEGNEVALIEEFRADPGTGNFQGFARVWQYTLANGATLTCAFKVRIAGTNTGCKTTVDAAVVRVTAIKR